MGFVLQRLKEEHIIARKERNAPRVGILTFILGEIERNPNKDASDKAIQATLTKVRKNLEKTLSVYPSDLLKTEIEVINEFLPSQMSEESLGNHIRYLVDVEHLTNVGQIMKALRTIADKSNPPMNFNGKLASDIAKEALLEAKV